MTGYSKQGPWTDLPARTTPLLSAQLNNWDDAIYDVKRRQFSVLDYGAKGDGATDDTAAIQACQADALAAKGWVYWPRGASGVYCTTGLTVSDHEKWLGDGVQDVRLKYTGTSGGILLQPADATQVTDYVQIRDLKLDANSLANTCLYMPSCQEWKVWNVEAANPVQAGVKIYGQRTAIGGVNPSDSTYNKFYNLRCTGSGSIAGVWLTGTKARTSTVTTLNGALTSGATTITVADTSSFASSGQILIDDEWVNYSGKTSTTFTGCTRGYWNSTAAAHSSGATVGVAARLSGGASNLNTFIMPRCSSQTGRGIWVDQGSSNYFAQPVGNLTTQEGILFSWYSNTVVGGITENCGSGGYYQLNVDETTSEGHDNWFFGVHNGGNPGGATGFIPSLTLNTSMVYGAVNRQYGTAHGEVNSDGTIARGSGFTVTKNGTGDYTVTFTNSLSGTPVVTATQPGGAAGMTAVSSRTSSAIRFLTFNSSGTATDRAFCFAAKVPS